MRRLLTCLLLCLALPATAQLRVVSLAPSLTETMLDLGASDLLVGVLDGGERPPALADLPSVGRYGQLQAESLLSLRPDLVLLWPDSVGAAGREQLKKLSIPQLVVEPRNLAQLAASFVELGERVGRAEQGRQLAARFEMGLAELRQRHQRDVPLKVFYQVWDQPLYTLGGQQIVSDALKLCGAENVFADLLVPAPQVGIEAVLQRDPAVILVSEPSQASGWAAWPQLAAVRKGQVWPVPDRGLERPSFQMLGATEKLCQLLDIAR
ncbi:cobalamin-binding protein [Pseudomonas sp. TCU-HL1]|uniref:cobalamin-binding protein n=1 Tax=Pseudomonas sp. TCU-HL1 TaxID=1856685 RepID=UPI00083D06FB|nr:cobalamin-binding protein [Pseudomonas sp. TCU-HL1]AOE83327.1 iron-hydroxamate ABC transporter substrate-binding protein [Pseudomonas sp. TCU-HL1]